MASIDQILSIWKKDSTIRGNITAWETSPNKPPFSVEFPDDLQQELVESLNKQGITALYSHQMDSYRAIQSRNNVVIATGTASGKSLCFLLPILNDLSQNPGKTALLIYPTKALAQDQFASILLLARKEFQKSVAVYDGDTPTYTRNQIRKNSRIIITNPDMLHTAILPHHTTWEPFLRGLSYMVLDEIHTYRGVFGAHINNLIRRLKRICVFYTSRPAFILTSATIRNPQEHAQNLIEETALLIDQNGAPQGERNFILYNPPVVNPDLGIRRSSLSEAVRLGDDLIQYGIQTLIFTQTRRAAEMGMKYLQEKHPEEINQIFAYRSGYLSAERRHIEQALKTGAARAVVATNALELGVDIGSMDAVVMVGYPGTIAATRQQAGRAGRRTSGSLAVLVASANPLDQYLTRHPDFILTRSPEMALINPNNPILLLQHLRCALFELAFKQDDPFGVLAWDEIKDFLEAIEQFGEAHQNKGHFFWVANRYPAQEVSLRSGSSSSVLLQTSQDGKISTIGEVDQISAVWMVHPGAVYLHQAQTYSVTDLDLEKRIATLEKTSTDYFTEPLMDIQIQKLVEYYCESVPGAEKHLSELLVTSQMKGFRKVRWYSNEHLGSENISLPPNELRTMGYWIELKPEVITWLEELNLWTGAPNKYGPNWDSIRNQVRLRDRYTCQNCGLVEQKIQHHVHHKIPFRQYSSADQANRHDNLITLCPSCHKKAEGVVRMRSGIAGLTYTISQLAPLFVMCDPNDLGSHYDPQSPMAEGQPVIVIYDKVPAGIGLSEHIYKIHHELLSSALEHVLNCACPDGCPSCIGVAGEFGQGGKPETIALLKILNGKDVRL